jgi:shikimate dehydrogenase
MTRLLALLGDPVEHSLSPVFQNAALEAEGVDARYLALRCSGEDLPGLLRGIARAGGAGNVTVPHKAAAAAIVEAPSAAVRLTGACNTFWHEGGVIHGDNTDVAGAHDALRHHFGSRFEGGRAVVLGAGGASRAVILALDTLGVREIEVRNRTVARARALVKALAPGVSLTELHAFQGPMDASLEPSVSLVVNATTLGLGPDDPSPYPVEELPDTVALHDLVYRPGETRWVREARARGIEAFDGREMLLRQGMAAFERWCGRPAPEEVMRQALRRAAAGEYEG